MSTTTPKLQGVLTTEELQSIPENVKNKLETHFVNLSQTEDVLRKEITKITTETDKHQLQYEKDAYKLRTQLEASQESEQKLKTLITEHEENINSLQHQLKEIQLVYNSDKLELESLKRNNGILQEEKQTLVNQLEKRREDIEKLNADLKSFFNEKAAANEQKNASVVRAEEAQMRESNLKHQVTRLEQEKKLLEQQIADLNVELSQKSHELNTSKREKSTILLELESQLQRRVDEVYMLEKQVVMFKESSDEKDLRIEALATKIRSMNLSSRQTEEQFNLEQNAQNKLTELYKKASEDNHNRVTELVSAFEEAQKVLQEITAAKEDAERNSATIEKEYEVKLQQMQEEVEKLNGELKHANDLCEGKAFRPESLESLFPIAATTSKVIHSDMTLTQLYTEYVKAQEEVGTLKVENNKLRQQLKQVVTELEESTPVFTQKMKEYHKCMEEISCLRTQLASAMTDYENMLNEKNDVRRSAGQLEREGNRLKSQVTDLNRQVQVLLKEVEEARGGFVALGAASEDTSFNDDTTASKVISRHLVTFRDVMELQTRNQQLLAVLRQLSDDQEEQEKQRMSEKTEHLEKELENALARLEELQQGRLKQTDLVNSILRQRDMFRALLSHHGVSETVLRSPEKSFPLNPDRMFFSPSARGDQNMRSSMQQMQAEFDQYRKEKAENERLLNEQLEKARGDISNIRIEHSRLTTQLEYSEERIGILETNKENYKKEASFLREKNLSHSSLITKHQQTIQSMQHETMELHEKLAKSLVTIDNLKKEKAVLKNAEERLLQEKESVFKEQQHTSQVMANLQTLQNNFERLELESKRNSQYQKDKYESENASLKMKLESANEDYKSAVALWKVQAQELQQKIDAEVEKNTKLHEDLVDAYAKFHSASQELSKSGGDKSAGTSPIIAQSANELKNVKEQLLESQAKAKVLQNQLEISRSSSERYSKMCNDLELRLKELDEINAQLKESMETALRSSTEARTEAEQQVIELQKTNRNLIEENMKLGQEKDTKVQELTKELSALQNQIAASTDSVQNAQQIASQARQDSLMQTKLMEETQERYERELLLHAQNVQTLANLKAEHQKCLAKEAELDSLARKAEAALDEHRKSWAERETALNSEQTSLQQRNKDLDGQTTSLMRQMELMGTQLKALQIKSFPSLPAAMPDVDLRDTQHLLEIISYVKKEKEIVSTQFNSTQSENVRLRLKVEQLSSDLKELQKEYTELQNASQMKVMSETQHLELLRKVEMLGLLNDSNNLLRIEKTQLAQCKDELENKLSSLQLQVQPMNEQIKAMTLQVENLTAEREALQREVKSWQSRTNQLLEQSHRIGPQEYKNLMREMEELKNQKTRLTDEFQRKQLEVSQMSSNLLTAKKDTEVMRGEYNKKVLEYEKLCKDNLEHQKTMIQVKKIGRKYKSQYDELKVLYDALVVKANESAIPEQTIQELQKKIQEMEKASKDAKAEANADKENSKKALEQMRALALDKEDKTRKLLGQARQRINTVNALKNALNKERDDLKIENESLKAATGEASSRSANQKSKFEAEIAILETKIKTLQESVDALTKKNDELSLKLAQQKQSTKPTVVERGSSSEPLTANIKPLSTPTQPSGSGLRHTPIAASPATRSTPTASIRPMAIGTIGGTCQTRMAAVLPTTASTSASDDVVPSCSHDVTVLAAAGTVPQAAVQPTPATATVAPTTLAPTLTPSSSHTPVISEVVPTPAAEPQASQLPIDPAQNIHIASSSTVLSTHATALVSPRVEGIDAESTVETTPTATVIVSPPSTQLVQPNIKRKKEDSPGLESPDAGGSSQKRVRMISEGSQTNQQTPVATSISMNVAIVPVATVVSRTVAVQPSTSAAEIPCEVIEEIQPESKSDSDDELEIIEVESKDGDQNIDWESQDDNKNSDFEVEIVDEDTVEQMEEFEEEPSPVFTARRDDEDMTEDTVEEMEEMSEQPAEVPHEVIDLDTGSDNQMESDTASLQTSTTDQAMAPPASPITQVVTEPTDAPSETVIGHVSQAATIQRRISQPPRFPSRQERLPPAGRQHLTPFTIQGQPASFEEGDDSIVPSTPTLFVPRRNDGFAEAVSSPHVPSVRFLFSSADSSPTQQGLSQLASQGALGVDDTRMDLSQFDEGGGRTVPSTPVLVSPPDEQSVPEVPEQFEQVILEPCTDSTVPSIRVEFVDPPSGTSTEFVETVPSSSTEQVAASVPEVKPLEKPVIEKAEVTIVASSSTDESETVKKEPEVVSTKATSQASVRKPIVWEKEAPTASTAPLPITIVSQAPSPLLPLPTPTTKPSATAQKSIPPPPRVRRMRYRGGTSLGRGNQPNYSRRGRGRSRMF